MKFENIISVCHIKHLSVWKKASINIIKYIESENYTVIVPQIHLAIFKKNSPSEYKIISEEKYKPSFNAKLESKSYKSKTNINWYFQQFLKLSALEEISSEKFGLIWDADSVPLKKLIFIKKNKVLFYKSSEFHKPYFDNLETLLKFKKKNNHSFIAQCMPVKGIWFKELLKTIEDLNKKKWQDAIIESIKFEQIKAFSEYEMIGTYVQNNYLDEIEIINNKWYRNGNSLIGSINNLKYFSRILSLKYDFIAFEKWDKFNINLIPFKIIARIKRIFNIK